MGSRRKRYGWGKWKECKRIEYNKWQKKRLKFTSYFLHFCSRHRICIFLITLFQVPVCFYLMFGVSVSVSVSVYACQWGLVRPYVCLYVERSTWHLSFISAGVLDTNVTNVDVGLDALNCTIVNYKLAFFLLCCCRFYPTLFRLFFCSAIFFIRINGMNVCGNTQKPNWLRLHWHVDMHPPFSNWCRCFLSLPFSFSSSPSSNPFHSSSKCSRRVLSIVICFQWSIAVVVIWWKIP